MIETSNFNFLPSEQIVGYFMKFEDTSDNSKIPINFIEMGYSSQHAIINLGSSFLYLIAYVLLCIGFILIVLPFGMLSLK